MSGYLQEQKPLNGVASESKPSKNLRFDALEESPTLKNGMRQTPRLPAKDPLASSTHSEGARAWDKARAAVKSMNAIAALKSQNALAAVKQANPIAGVTAFTERLLNQENLDMEKIKHKLFEHPVDLPEDVYTMFFVSEIGRSHAFWLAIYIFGLKMVNYTFLALEALERLDNAPSIIDKPMVLAAQVLMIPVAVAIEDDIIATFFIFANLKYDSHVETQFPEAKAWKFYVANLIRGIDGFYLLAVNFAVMLTALDVLTLFLNFAALLFLQELDNLAVGLSANGYLSDDLEEVANNAIAVTLPRSHSKWRRAMDTVCLCGTVAIMLICWAAFHFWIPRKSFDLF